VSAATRPPRAFYDRLWGGGTDRENRARWRFQEELVGRALERLAAAPGGTVVEIGPGPGRETVRLAARGARVVAVDLSLAALGRVRAATGGAARPVLARAEALPLAAGSVDAVFAQTVLMHLDLGAAAREWARVLRPGGRVVVLEPLAGHPLLRLYRRFLSPYRATAPRYLTVAALAAAAPGLRLRHHEEHYLGAVLALGLPAPVAGPARRVLGRVDRELLRFRPLRAWAWMTLAELERE
jgi:SAM-dependent methyltransferase